MDKRDVQIGMLKEAIARRGLAEPEELALGGKYEGGDEGWMDGKRKKRAFSEAETDENSGAQ